jgi:type VI secretion system secreted protein Hcp
MTNWIRSLVVAGSVLGVALAPLAEAEAALNAYLKLKGQKQGDIKGSVAQKGREGAIKVIAVSHEILSPRDAASGLPTGKRQHKPLVITKELDKSSPLLFQALVQNENFPSLELTVFGINAKGIEAPEYTIKLTNAKLSAVRMVQVGDKMAQEVSFTYQKIEWTWVDGGITAMDDWESPNAAK